jgi:hypothetical protein
MIGFAPFCIAPSLVVMVKMLRVILERREPERVHSLTSERTHC